VEWLPGDGISFPYMTTASSEPILASADLLAVASSLNHLHRDGRTTHA
jgi:hypothetical protein